MQIHEIKVEYPRKRKKRVGRGIGSGHGKTAGRGTKGQKARENVSLHMEGGQTPLHLRLPKQKGFKNPFKKEWQIVNLKDLKRLGNVQEVTPELLYERGLIKEKDIPVKILGEGEINVPLIVKANAFSSSAREKIEKAGGRAEVIG
ncbi:MAG: 50S ribosomal protein L15 [bacterium]